MSGQDAPVVPLEPYGFSYASLDAGAAAVAREAAEVIQGVQRAFTLEVGRQLLRVKDALPHGAFEQWVRGVLDMKPRTARNCMKAARWLDGKPATVADLPPTLLYALADPAAPAEIVSSVVADAHAGTALDVSSIRAKLAAADMEQQELKAAQKRSPKLTVAELRARHKRQADRCAAERARDVAAAEAEKAEREQRVRPLVQKVTSLLEAVDVAALLSVLSHYQDREAFAVLLREAGQ